MNVFDQKIRRNQLQVLRMGLCDRTIIANADEGSISKSLKSLCDTLDECEFGELIQGVLLAPRGWLVGLNFVVMREA